MMNLTPMVKNLLIINLVAFFAFEYFGSADKFALYNFQSSYFAPYQFLTYMFMHANGTHLLMNMIGVFFFGPLLESRWGSSKFLLFYLVTGVGAALFYSGVKTYEFSKLRNDVLNYIEKPTPINYRIFVEEYIPGRYDNESIIYFKNNAENPELIKATIEGVKNIYNSLINSPMVGASGALFGILMAFGMLFPNTELMLLFIPFPIKAKYLVFIFGLMEVYALVKQNPNDNVAHLAHLGGMLFGFILIKVWERDRSNFY